jgi:dimethylglycine dehydrogenase
MEAGKDLGIKPFGIRAMNSLRLEKSYKLVGN